MSENYQAEANLIAIELIKNRKQKGKELMKASIKTYLPLEQVTKPNLTTDEAAYYLNRQPQTLRVWACLENGPIEPRKICGLLAWSTKDIKTLVGV